MANKSIFSTKSTSKFPVANTVNLAGGVAYDLGAEGALAQYVVTGTLNQTFYASADEQVDKVLELAGKCSNEFIAKAAVYARKTARMKDTPALLLNILANRGPEGLEYLERVFPVVINDVKMLRNFCQILRSGKCGRKSFGSAVKRLIQSWLTEKDAENLFKGSVGNDPSLADVVKMVHPKPEKKEKEAFYAWLLGKEYNTRYLPKAVKQFEAFKSGKSKEVPEVDFRMLTALPLTTEQWSAIARNASWNTVRMNLNTFERHGCYKDDSLVEELSTKLKDEKLVRKSNAFPYQLLTTFQAVDSKIPQSLTLALQDALEIATTNVPALNGRTAVCIDTSGSMSSPVTGYRQGATTTTTCVDVAGLMAACVLRQNPNTTIVPFDTMVHIINVNPRDSIMTNARKLARGGGGTDCSSALRYLNAQGWKGDTVIFVSDNASWYVPPGAGYGYAGRTGMVHEWEILKKRNPKAKLICIDIQPGSTTQVPDRKDVLNIGGFADSVFEVVANFVNGDSRDFTKVINDSAEL
jgi:60 kDa SS-A/Ro ribonucleoprotein